MKSLSRNFLLSVGITSISITLLGSIAAFVAYRNDLAARQMTHLREYVEQRQRNVSRRFGSIAGIQQAARTKLTADMDRLSDADIDRLIERDYPRQADGTRRSRPEAFDGVVEPNGDIISGIGAFLSPGLIPADEKRAMVAAFHVVHHFGVGVQSSYDNFYFVTPNNRVVLFAPNRPDRLLFYRKTAPASLDFSREEMMTMIGPAKNPLGRTRCTSLQRLIQDPEGRRLATACLTPVTYKGRFVGAFGSSLQMGNYMPAAVGAQIEDVTSLLVRGEGSVIAYPGQQPGEPASTETLTKVERDFHVRELMRRIQAKKQDSGVIGSHSGRNIVGFAHIPEPDWWVLLAYSEADVRDKAFRSASWILVLGLAASLLQTALIVWLARRTIALPLRRLTDTRQTDALPPDLLRRRDEIGALGRALGDERAKTQALLTSLEERVVARTAELRRASSEKDRFLANMSHELRTPLNGVIAVSETLAQLQRSRRGKEMAHLIVQSSRLLEHVLSDILDVSRLDAGRIVLASEVFELERVLAHIAELHRAVAVSKRLDLQWSVDPEAAGAYVGDPVRLTQVVSNLLSNAVKFTERGEVRLHAACADGRLRLTVRDTGIGFDQATAERLFQRFEQADPSISRRFGGSGLGLAICRSLVDAMGGAIRASSAPGVGSTFVVDVPLARAPDAAAGADESADADETALSGARVLLAEDHPTNQKVVELILETAGVRLTTVDDGRAALEMLNTRPFDLVLMDMQMPHMDGLSATRLWREKEALLRLPRMPIVMLTANALPEHVQQSLEAGADRHLAKPIRAGELLQVVETLSAPGLARRAA